MLREIWEAVRDQSREVLFWFQDVRVVRIEGTRPPLFELLAWLRACFDELLEWAWVGVWIAVVVSVILTPVLLVLVLLKVLFFGL